MLQAEYFFQGHLGFSPPCPLQQVLFLCPAFLSCALQQHSVINGSQLLSPGYLFLQVSMSRDLENLWWGKKLPQWQELDQGGLISQHINQKGLGHLY